MDLHAVEFVHDLKMPIQLIYSCVQLLEMELQSGSRAEGYLKMLMQSTDQLQSMVMHALDEKRGSSFLCMENRDIVSEVRDLCNQVTLFAGEKSIRVDYQSNAARFYMKTDAEKLERILQNLLSNALRFTPENGRVGVTVHVMGDSVEISVSDTGCGFSDGARIFDRGYTTGGNGHGLAIAREYAALLGGSISAHSGEGGSCFVLRLPVQN